MCVDTMHGASTAIKVNLFTNSFDHTPNTYHAHILVIYTSLQNLYHPQIEVLHALLKIWCWHNTFRGVNMPFKYNTQRVLTMVCYNTPKGVVQWCLVTLLMVSFNTPRGC